jgi:Protein of unknown function (DUF3108)
MSQTLPALPLPRAVPAAQALRRGGWLALLVAVLLAHALATLWLQDNLAGWGEGDKPMPQRIEVAFVQALAPAAPPAAAPVPQAAPKPARARAPAAPASAPQEAAARPAVVEVAPVLEGVEAAPPPVVAASAATASTVEPPAATVAAVTATASASASATASAPVVVAAASAPATGFDWPPSTRLTYSLKGNYRGEVNGNARVQWVRQGARYQVHLDVSIGPSFAPLISRRMTSDGELSEKGLVPQRYDEATRLPFRQPRRVSLAFTPEQVTLANGSQQPSLPGLQDSASQFVQLTWLFTTQPELLRAGNSVTLPLALPRRVGRWVYDVLGQERLTTPIGEIDTYHLKPRLGERRPGNELSAEVWFAPTLQYLPVRIRIQQDEETFVDLMLDAAPLQAAPEAAPPR